MSSITVEEFFRIYELSPGLLDKNEIKEATRKIARELKIDEDAAFAVLNFLEQNLCVYEIARSARVSGYGISLDDTLDILESLRREGFLRVIGVKNPDDFEREEVITLVPALAEEEYITPRTIEEKISVEGLKEEINELFKEETPKVEMPEKPVKSPFAELEKDKSQMEIIRIGEVVSEKIRFDIESLLSLNEFIQNILIATRDGLPILQITRKNVPGIDDAKIAAAASVIMAMSSKTTEDIGKKELDNVIVRTDKSLIVVGYIDSSYILTFLTDAKTPMGLMLADFNNLRKKIAKLIESMQSGG